MSAASVPVADQLVVNAPTTRPIGRPIFERMMEAARSWWPSKAAVELAAILGCDVRSAERYLAGDRTPDANAVIALLNSGHAMKVIAFVANEMPPKQQAAFWKEMAKAARRAELLEERDRLDRELRQVSG